MVVATVDEAGPDARTVLCKGIGMAGIVFYTNTGSAKARQLGATPRAAAVFTWPEISRQVRLRGTVESLPREQVLDYWRTRPRGSQLGAWASDQSQPIASRAALDAALDSVAARFPDPASVPLPPFWGGYRLVPDTVEFWQGMRDRLHSRLVLHRHHDTWTPTRLQP
jgi:pyridoxamine 5'-phosphate oxidase